MVIADDGEKADDHGYQLWSIDHDHDQENYEKKSWFPSGDSFGSL